MLSFSLTGSMRQYPVNLKITQAKYKKEENVCVIKTINIISLLKENLYDSLAYSFMFENSLYRNIKYFYVIKQSTLNQKLFFNNKSIQQKKFYFKGKRVF